MVEVFARELQKEGRKVAVLSRGYKKVEPRLARKLLDALFFREHCQRLQGITSGFLVFQMAEPPTRTKRSGGGTGPSRSVSAQNSVPASG